MSFPYITVDHFNGGGSKPYELRGIELGMTLSDFRELKHPDDASAVLLCTRDRDVGLGEAMRLIVPDDERIAGVIYCGWFEAEKSYLSGPLPSRPEMLMNVATANASVNFKFVPDDGGELRLYEIVVRTDVRYWDELWAGYTGKYGKPTAQTEEPVQNNAGAKFDNTKAVWENKDSSIGLVKRAGRVDTSLVLYEHKALLSLVKKKIEAERGRPASKL